MCNNCLTDEGCSCPAGKSVVHCACDPYLNQYCSSCGHTPLTTDKSAAGSESKKQYHRG